MGWSTQNSHEYKNHKCTIAGNIKPFLRDGNIPEGAKRPLSKSIKLVLSQLPIDHCFNVEKETDELVKELRKDMIAGFHEMLGGSRKYDSSFRIEGITIVIPRAIGKHMDTLNCSRPGMTTVVCISVVIPMKVATIKGGKTSKLWIWLEQNSYSKSFPVNILLYTRKAVYHHCLKVAGTRRIGETDPLKDILVWAFTERIGSSVDYHNRVWNDFDFPIKFKETAKKKCTSRFGGKLMLCSEHYDKMVSDYCFILLSNTIV